MVEMKTRENGPRIILASDSPRRRELMHLLGLEFHTAVAGVVEEVRGESSPLQLVCRLSQDKGRAVSARGTGDIIVSSDTIVVLDGNVLGKPADEVQARAMLRALRGRRHHVLSAVTVIDRVRGSEITDWADTAVEMRDYSDEEIETYIGTADPMDKAGAYAIQHAGFHPVRRIEGCYASVMGFPLCHLYRALQRIDVEGVREPVRECLEFTGYPCNFYPTVLSSADAGN